MSYITVETAREMLFLWLEAERAVTSGKSYSIGSRSLSRNDISDIRDAQKYWRDEIEKLESGRTGARVMRAVPRDW